MTLLEGSGSHLEPSARESTTAATVSSMPSTHGVVIRDLHYQEKARLELELQPTDPKSSKLEVGSRAIAVCGLEPGGGNEDS